MKIKNFQTAMTEGINSQPSKSQTTKIQEGRTQEGKTQEDNSQPTWLSHFFDEGKMYAETPNLHVKITSLLMPVIDIDSQQKLLPDEKSPETANGTGWCGQIE